mmetsp:Transcript_57232/g.48332  ORF Transcript_57232/g.48332 Transcript_57232/m.48332 type:complete len:107 (+) Transcript_57232:140-460(+)
MIIGTEDSPYHNGFYIYKIWVTEEYPFKPPKCQFMSTNGTLRFHPNMYADGKVCLSILGTWNGPEWNPLLNLSSVAVTISSLFDSNPIRHEPGYENKDLSDVQANN